MLVCQASRCRSSKRPSVGRTHRDGTHGVNVAVSTCLRRGGEVAGATVKEDVGDPVFSIGKMVLLAQDAFGAYLDPSEKQGLVMKRVDGTMMRFFDSQFVQEAYDGVLEVTGISAKMVSADTDLNSKSHFHLTATLGDSFASTSTKLNNDDPAFHESLDIWVPKGKGMDEITVAVFDDDRDTSEGAALATASFRLPNLREQSNEIELKLKGDMAGHCVVKLTATFLPFGGASGDEFLEEVDGAKASNMAEAAPAAARGMKKSISDMGLPPDEDLREAWDTLSDLCSESMFTDKRAIAFINHLATGTQLWISRDVPERKVVVAFRGTEPTRASEKFADMFTDVDLWQVPMELREDLNASAMRNFFDSSKWFSGRSKPMVHNGFYDSYQSVRETVLKTIDECTAGESDWHVYVTGHSLGGGLALLLAYELEKRASPKYPLTMYNYGGPRVGNGEFVDNYNVKDTWRIHNQHDMVATIPQSGLMGYKHVDTGVRVMDNGGFVFTNHLNEDVELKGGTGAKWSAKNIITEIEERVEEAEEILAKNKETFSAIASGDAVNAHLEPFYLDSLAKCLEDMPNVTSTVAEGCEKTKACVARSKEKASS